MMHQFLKSVLFLLFWANVVSADSYVTVRIEGQLGNQLFQIATA